MDSDPTRFYVAGLVACYLVSTFFSAIKIIFSSSDRNSIPSHNERLRYFASKIDAVNENALFAVSVSFGKTVANSTFAVLAFVLTRHLLPDRPAVQTLCVSVVSTVTVLSLCAYTIPRALVTCFPRRLLVAAYTTYSLLSIPLFPFARLINAIHDLILRVFRYDEKLAFLTAEEKSRLGDSPENGEALDEEEKEMIHSIFELGETTAKEVMVPRIDMKALDITTDFATALTTIREAGHSRIPVFRDTIDSIVGILYAKDILSWISENPDGEWDLEALLKTPHFVPNGKKLDDLMAEFKKRQIHMAIVVDEYGGTAGMVTMEDILEEIVGDIQDEYDTAEESVVRVGTSLFHVEPHIELDDLSEKLDVAINTNDAAYNTLGGLIYDEYGDVPQENTEFEFSGLRLKILKMDNQRIQKVEVEVIRKGNDSKDLRNSF